MKANATPRKAQRRFASDERGVSEAIGYVITFGISTIILVTSLHTFNSIQDYTRDLAIDRGLRELGAQVAFAVEEAVRAGDTYPDTAFSMRIAIPRDIHGEGYRVYLNESHVWLVSLEAQAVTKGLAKEDLDVRGRYHVPFVQRVDAEVLCTDVPPVIVGLACFVNSEEGELTVVYDDPDGGGGSGAGVYFAG